MVSGMWNESMRVKSTSRRSRRWPSALCVGVCERGGE